MIRHQYKIAGLLLILALGICQSCKKYLGAVPDKSQAVPSDLSDVRALLNNFLVLRTYSPVMEIASDDYYLTYSGWTGLSSQVRNGYIWQDDETLSTSAWNNLYQAVFYTNLAMETLKGLPPDVEAGELKSTALFFRGYTFYFLSQMYAKQYDETTAEKDDGIVLRLSPDGNEKSVRSTLAATYKQIISDFKGAALNLPDHADLHTQPSKIAAYAALARTYLVMGAYQDASQYADSVLLFNDALIDFNDLNVSVTSPISQFNQEVIFHSSTGGAASLVASRALVDSSLYNLYEGNDLRKVIFYTKGSGNTYKFKASYNGSVGSTVFNGITSPEVYLIKAEAEARLGNTSEAMLWLNRLLIRRWKNGTFVPIEAATAEDALKKVIIERRKELVLRCLRWTDLRRLNKEPAFRKDLTRILNNTEYELPAGDARYILLIPQVVIDASHIPQNSR